MMTSPQPGPLAPYVVPFVVELRATGFCASTISVFSRTVRCFDQWLRRKRIKVRQIDEGVIQQHHRYRQRLRMQSHGADAALRRLLLRLREWEACPARQEAPPSAIEVFLAYFRDHLAAHRGLAPSTIRVRIAVAHRFLRLYPLHTSVGASMSIGAAVSAFIRTEAQGHGPQTAKALAAGLRALLRFLAFRGAIDAKAVDCVPAVAQWRMVSIPRHLTRDQLRKLLSIPDRTSVVGRRDYAILLLLARLGLRSTEVVRLTLGDIDWRGHCLSVRSKGGGRSQLPLLPEIECAIADYMRHSRPQ